MPMTPYERAVAVVETTGWIIKTETPVDIPLPAPLSGSARATVTSVTIKGEVLTGLIEAAIRDAVINERHACMIVAQDYADAGTCCGHKAMEIYHAIANRTLAEARAQK